MTEDIDQRLIARIGRRQGRSTWPRAVAMEPQVRTPIDIVPITESDDEDRRELSALPAFNPDAPSFEPYLFEWWYDVHEDARGAFRDWLGIYETDLRRLCPDHFRYLGTFEAVFGASGQGSGSRYRTLWQHADLAGTLYLLRRRATFQKYDQNQEAVEKLSDDQKKELIAERRALLDDETYFLKLLRELISFQDTSSAVRASQLYQLASLGSTSVAEGD
jgi:hypothetical protein